MRSDVLCDEGGFGGHGGGKYSGGEDRKNEIFITQDFYNEEHARRSLAHREREGLRPSQKTPRQRARCALG